ncbi:uncharacterized protein LOC121376477 [Gigantopelta aegis]|uniref:uncharacterized protein LOC121376477 n=1 Tax=Gigantopelta aegis TaxID=1735272 RepID=UPI001B88D7BC|nr:uncharacterized protein LOC121376477 [Gigantopelta aegis]
MAARRGKIKEISTSKDLGKLRCIIHVCQGVEGKLTTFSATTWDKCVECATKWSKLTGELSDISNNLFRSGVLDIPFSKDACVHFGYHKSCYQKFTNKIYIEKSQKASDKTALVVPEENESNNDDTDVSSPKKLRSSSVVSKVGESSCSVLPALCIICKKKDLCVTVGHKRVKDKLIHAETESAGQLREAATQKCDETILLHIRDKDCVAIEVKYHRSCYKNYTRFLRKKKSEPVPIQQYSTAYALFCETVVVTRLLKNHEILRMSLLLLLFRRFVSKHEMNDATSYRTDQLKRRIENDYPQLTFHSPCRKNVSELVFTETLSHDDLLEGFQSESELGSDLTPSDTDTEASSPMKSTVSGL